jgi:hypothetical protein
MTRGELVLAISATLILGGEAPLFGQWSENGTSVYYNNGSVGVGTTNPQALFHVQEAASTTLDWIGMLNNQGASGGTGFGVQSKLPAKVEELTLHMIRAEEENRDLRERLAKLEAEGKRER